MSTLHLPISPYILPYIVKEGEVSTLHLPISPLHLPYTSPTSPYISLGGVPRGRQAGQAGGHGRVLRRARAAHGEGDVGRYGEI